MAKKPETEQGASGIALVSKRKWGYDVPQVDKFLEHAHELYDSEGMQLTQKDIQNVSFDMRKGGYAIAQVDAALTRLERAVVDKQTTWEITQHGRVAWKAQTEELYRQIAEHAKRPQRKRFAAGTGKQPSYDRKQVDRLVDQIVDKAAAELGIGGADQDHAKKDIDLNAQRVSNVIFTQRRGHRGYDERQVDYYINACVQLLSRIESYARVADYVGTPDEQAAQQHADNGVKPLFAQSDQHSGQDQELPQFAPGSAAASLAAASAAASTVPAAEATQSFDALHEAEQAIFTQTQSQTPSVFGQPDQPASETTSLFDQSTPVAPVPPTGTAYSPVSSVPSFDAAAVNQQTIPTQQATDLPSFAPSSDSAIRAAQESLQGSPSLAALAGSHASTPASAAATPSVTPSFGTGESAAASSPSITPSFGSGLAQESGSTQPRQKLGEIPGVYAPAPSSAFTPDTPAVPVSPVSTESSVPPASFDSAPTAAFASPFNADASAQAVQEPVAPVAPQSQPSAPATTDSSTAAAAADTTSAAQQQTPDRQKTAKPTSVGLFPKANPAADSGFGFDIPDLSFPTWNDDNSSGK